MTVVAKIIKVIASRILDWIRIVAPCFVQLLPPRRGALTSAFADHAPKLNTGLRSRTKCRSILSHELYSALRWEPSCMAAGWRARETHAKPTPLTTCCDSDRFVDLKMPSICIELHRSASKPTLPGVQQKTPQAPSVSELAALIRYLETTCVGKSQVAAQGFEPRTRGL